LGGKEEAELHCISKKKDGMNPNGPKKKKKNKKDGPAQEKT